MMIIKKQLITMLCLFIFSSVASAYNARSEEDKTCKKPKFRTFSPEHLSEVAPGSEISFHVSNWADPDTIRAEARKLPVKLTIINKNVFFVAKGKLPEKLNNTYARINLYARAKEGGCLGQDGWLLKISDAPKTESPSKEQKEVTEQQATQ